MKKRGEIGLFSIVIIILISFATIHTAIHLTFYGTGITGFAENGISGFVIGNESIESIKEKIEVEYPKAASISKKIIILQWLILLIVILTSATIERILYKKNFKNINLKIETKSRSQTDLDLLYDYLKKNKRLSISSIAKAFNVSIDIAIEWAKILESGNLAFIHYPRIGEPELVIASEAKI